MKRALSLICLLLLAAAPAFAEEYFLGDLQVRGQATVEAPSGFGTNVATLAYSNVGFFTGSTITNGGATLQGANTITTLVADDCTPLGGTGGLPVIGFTFSVANLNGAAATFRPRVRFWNADGAGGAPGSYYSNPAAVGFSFNPITLNGLTITLLTATLAPNQFNMPAGTFWAGTTFDNNNGATGATAGVLNNLAQGIFDPPSVGSSADLVFITSAAGSFFTIPNPAGSFLSTGTTPPANLAWEFVVDAPVPAQSTSWSRVKSLYR